MAEIWSTLEDIWSTLETFIETNFDRPLFQLGQGIFLGATVVGAIRAVVRGYRAEKAIREIEDETEAEDDD